MAKLIHIVGTSGAGKGTLQKSLADRLRSEGRAVELLQEPGPLRDFIKEYRLRPDRNAWTELALFCTDRTLLFHDKVLPRIGEDIVFLSDRGLPDTVVYQGLLGGIDPKIIMRMHDGLPRSDLYLCLTVDGLEGECRARERAERTGKPMGPGDSADAIEQRARAYQQLPVYFDNVRFINTTELSPEMVLATCHKYVRGVFDG